MGRRMEHTFPVGCIIPDHGMKDTPTRVVTDVLERELGPNCNQTGGKLELNWYSSGLSFHGNMMAVRWWGCRTQVGEDANSS